MEEKNQEHGGKSCEDAELELLESRKAVARLTAVVARMSEELEFTRKDLDRALMSAQKIREGHEKAKHERVADWKEKKLRASGACTKPERFIAAPSFEKAQAEERVREAHRAHLRRTSDRQVAL